MYSSNGFCKISCLNDKFLAWRPFQIQCGSVDAVLAAECPTKSGVMRGTLLKYERTVATASLCHTALHSAMPGQALAEEFCESVLTSLVTKKGQNRGVVTIEDLDDL